MNTYTKLKNGQWGVRVDGTATKGSSVTVTTKSGKTKTETILAVLWSGNDRTSGKAVALCAIQQNSNGARSYARANNYAPGGRTCPNCGQRGCSGAWGDLCDED